MEIHANELFGWVCVYKERVSVLIGSRGPGANEDLEENIQLLPQPWASWEALGKRLDLPIQRSL